VAPAPMTEDERNRRRGLMLAFIRDVIVERGQAMRSCYALAESTVSAKDDTQLKKVVALEAAGDVFTHLVAEWQRSGKDPPAWLEAIAKQGMATFTEALK